MFRLHSAAILAPFWGCIVMPRANDRRGWAGAIFPYLVPSAEGNQAPTPNEKLCELWFFIVKYNPPMTSHHNSPTELMPTLLTLRGLGVSYGNDQAVQGVDLSIHQGEIIGLIGPNGAGKSTLLKAILGLLPVSAGTIEFKKIPGPQEIGYVPQRLALDPTVPFSVLEFLSLNLPNQRAWLPRKNPPGLDLIRSQLAAVQAGHLIDRSLGSLSGGEFQRITIAYALLRSPRLLLLDEPTTGIDQQGSEILENLLRSLRNERGIAVLIVSHDLHLISDLSDRVCCLNRHMCAVGSPTEVMEEHFLHEIYGRQRLLTSARSLDLRKPLDTSLKSAIPKTRNPEL